MYLVQTYMIEFPICLIVEKGNGLSGYGYRDEMGNINYQVIFVNR